MVPAEQFAVAVEYLYLDQSGTQVFQSEPI